MSAWAIAVAVMFTLDLADRIKRHHDVRWAHRASVIIGAHVFAVAWFVVLAALLYRGGLR